MFWKNYVEKADTVLKTTTKDIISFEVSVTKKNPKYYINSFTTFESDWNFLVCSQMLKNLVEIELKYLTRKRLIFIKQCRISQIGVRKIETKNWSVKSIFILGSERSFKCIIMLKIWNCQNSTKLNGFNMSREVTVFWTKFK